MTAARDSVTVRVPASTSNCGAGFDSLGPRACALQPVTLRAWRAGVAARVAPGDGCARGFDGGGHGGGFFSRREAGRPRVSFIGSRATCRRRAGWVRV